MRATYDSDVDAFYLYLAEPESVSESEEVKKCIVLDCNDEKQIVGIEVLHASKRLPLAVLKAAEQITNCEADAAMLHSSPQRSLSRSGCGRSTASPADPADCSR